VKFETYIPCDVLRPYITSFAVQEASEEKVYKVVPDTGLVIGFQYKGRLTRLDNENEIALSTSGMTGLSDRFNVFRGSADIGTVLVFFKEAGASVFFKQPLHELFRDSVSLDNFLLRSELLLVEEQLCEASSDRERVQVIERFLILRMNAREPDKLVLAALALIHQSKGNIRIRELMEQLHISQSPLEKRFRQAVGASPKKFASLVRLKSAIRRYQPKSSLTELAYEAGFYDQAHFVKEFKAFTGDTPEKYFKSGE
jgi:AraC-like DNA-binding protein